MEKNLNPQNPADAVAIIDVLTGDLRLTRKESAVFSSALHTLNKFVEVHIEKKESEDEKSSKPDITEPSKPTKQTVPKPPTGRTI